ncbi:MAG: methyltransferase domain-containing protein [Victivallales bacterium]|nr:methyltransferase domain-containing protein [Victivallales bacterium]
MRSVFLLMLSCVLMGYSREIIVNSRNSLVTAGDFVHTEITPAGREIAKELYASLELSDLVQRRKQQESLLEKCNAMLKAHPDNKEVLALAWFLDIMLKDKATAEASLKNPLEKAYYAFFMDSDCKKLKEYIQFKHQLKGYDDQDPEKMMRDLNMLQNALIFNSPTRVKWEPVDKIIAELHLKPGIKMAEAGCGQGFYTYKFSKLVGEDGMVYALDNDRGQIDFLQDFINREDIGNIQATRSTDESVMLTSNRVELLFYNQLYHLVYMYLPRQPRFKLIESIRKAIRPKGRLVIVDRYPAANTIGYSLDPQLIIGQLEFFGFKFLRQAELGQELYLLEFENEK